MELVFLEPVKNRGRWSLSPRIGFRQVPRLAACGAHGGEADPLTVAQCAAAGLTGHFYSFADQ